MSFWWAFFIGVVFGYDVQRERPMPVDPPLTAAEAALLRRAATMPVDELDRLIRHVDQVIDQKPHVGDN